MVSYSIRDINIVNKLDRAEKDLFSLKSRQGVGGRTLATKVITGAKLKSTYVTDVSGTSDQQYFVGYCVFRSDSQLNPHANLYLNFYEADGTTKYLPGDGPALFAFYPVPQDVDSHTYVWYLSVSKNDPLGTFDHFYIEPVVAATDTGSIVFVALGES